LTIVYKYGAISSQPGEGAIEHFLIQQTLRFASAATQNDINEAVPNIGAMLHQQMQRAASELYPKRAALNPDWKEMPKDLFIEAMYDNGSLGNANKIGAVRAAWKVAHSKFRKFGIASLTKSRNNLLLWSHYASGEIGAASGLCIGFDSSASVFSASKYSAARVEGMRAITYSPTRATFGAGTLEERLTEIVFTKSKEWAYEEELRCIRELPDDGSAIYCPFKTEDVREIIVGPNMPPAAVKQCIALHEAKFPHAELLVALPNPEQFTMIFYRCPKQQFAELAFQDSSMQLSALNLLSATARATT